MKESSQDLGPALSRYYDDRATGRDIDSVRFKKDWTQREKAVEEFLDLTGFDTADKLIQKFSESIDTKREIDSQLFKFYKTKCETMKRSSAKQSVMKIAAMFTSNYEKISTKQISKDAKETSGVRIARAQTPFFDYDEEGQVTGFNDLAREFFGRLNHRDRTVLLSSASSGQAVSVILSLTVAEIRQAKNNEQERIVLIADRNKTGEAYLTFISIEATKMIYNYLETERAKAEDSENLFMARADQPLKTTHLNTTTHRVCNAMGIIKNSSNPYTPYAMRSVFRTACDGVASIPENAKKRMMGHSLTEGEGYGVLGTSGVLPHYMKVEPLLTLAHQPSIAEKALNERLADLEEKLEQKDYAVDHLGQQVEELRDSLRLLSDSITKE